MRFGADAPAFCCDVDAVVDPDGDETALAYRWERNGATLDADGASLDLDDLVPGDVFTCALLSPQQSGSIAAAPHAQPIDRTPIFASHC